MTRFPMLLCLLACACEGPEAEFKRREREAWEGPCHDESTMVATTAGSPNRAACTNKRHRMRVQVAALATNEEAAAVVFCECDHGQSDASKEPDR